MAKAAAHLMLLLLVAVCCCTRGAQAQASCGGSGVQSLMSSVTSDCRVPSGRAWLTTCNGRCAPKFLSFWSNITSCPRASLAARFANSTALKNLAASCHKVAGNTSIKTCSSAALYPMLMECARFTSVALKDGVIDANDHFCQSACYRQVQLNSGCKDASSQAALQTFSALKQSDASCNAAGASDPVWTSVEAKINANCKAVPGGTGPGPGGFTVARADGVGFTRGDIMGKSGACQAACFDDIRWGMANNYSAQIKKMSMYPSVKGIVAYCNANRTNAQCHSSKGYALNQVMTACCGPQASRCASGTMPSTCSPTCASAFLPFYSQCGRVVWRNGQQLTKMVHFAIMCAKTRGRHITGSDTSWKNIVGPDPRDPCTRIANCTECNGSCGWCRKEVQNKVTLQSQHNGWCSSICVTSVLGPEFRRKHDLRERRS